jgi:hypothetical protein
MGLLILSTFLQSLPQNCFCIGTYIYIHIHTLHYITLHTYIPHKYIYIYRCAVWLVPNPCLPLFPPKASSLLAH